MLCFIFADTVFLLGMADIRILILITSIQSYIVHLLMSPYLVFITDLLLVQLPTIDIQDILLIKIMDVTNLSLGLFYTVCQ